MLHWIQVAISDLSHLVSCVILVLHQTLSKRHDFRLLSSSWQGSYVIAAVSNSGLKYAQFLSFECGLAGLVAGAHTLCS